MPTSQETQSVSIKGRFTHSTTCPCRSPAMPCREGFRMCLSRLIYIVRPCLIHTCHAIPMKRSDHAVLLKTTAQHGRQDVGYLPAFGFFWLPRGVPQRLLSEAYQSSSQTSIPTTVKSGSRTLQKRRSVKLLD